MMLSMTQVPEQRADEASPRLLTASQVADALDVSSETVLAWARADKIPCIKLPSGQRRFRREVIDAILAGDAA